MKSSPSIFSATRRAYRTLNAALKASSSINASDYEILRYIGDNPGVLRARIAEDTGIDLTSTGRIVRRFAERGWVEGEDHHYVPLTLTGKGEEAYRELGIVGSKIEKQAIAQIEGSPQDFIRDLGLLSGVKKPVE